ncbi:hypothetical protein COV04_03380 [Candidatus Uhrbacteria bacterium CG10_big_fil_rev_8_21_14_0_10_48_11]|uniref:EamA domain-containing protein n=1 Tax=Candidatus Uhrbacteria bacterium CG10_big_fil_rev_8_21_14_0_10_48_11 TaxID=1975037 RepID=A0A2M8LE64_9BACT|nr:MAG: hypothetical protein COV04_03380 [Candidatus Uhrbacteria bacterium CG10_big_fil_rev_8_21_14_0_10_48_11]
MIVSWFFILLSAVFLSARTILTKKVLFDNETMPLLFLVSLFSIIAMVGFWRDLTFFLSSHLYALLLLKSLLIAVSWFCIYQTFKYLPISTVARLRNLRFIFWVILAYFFLHESVTSIKYLGITILMISAYALELPSAKNFLEPLKQFKVGTIFLSLCLYLVLPPLRLPIRYLFEK